MAMKQDDLMTAFGPPPAKSGGSKPKGKEKGSGYLASKSPALQAFLLDAVDPALSQNERAEALCRAIEENAGSSAAPPAPEELPEY